jgi:peptidoglycan/xylan/chitin deacetylase (PgdA/CDA1 family)
LWSLLVRVTDDARHALLASLDQWAGNPPPLDPTARPMSPTQVSELLAGGLIRAGAHTATHAWLPALEHAEALAEIGQSRRDCGRLVGVDPVCFAYPFGAYDERTIERVREAGFGLAVTSDGGLAWADRDPLALPRIAVGNCSGSRLAFELRHYWLA